MFACVCVQSACFLTSLPPPPSLFSSPNFHPHPHRRIMFRFSCLDYDGVYGVMPLMMIKVILPVSRPVRFLGNWAFTAQ